MQDRTAISLLYGTSLWSAFMTTPATEIRTLSLCGVLHLVHWAWTEECTFLASFGLRYYITISISGWIQGVYRIGGSSWNQAPDLKTLIVSYCLAKLRGLCKLCLNPAFSTNTFFNDYIKVNCLIGKSLCFIRSISSAGKKYEIGLTFTLISMLIRPKCFIQLNNSIFEIFWVRNRLFVKLYKHYWVFLSMITISTWVIFFNDTSTTYHFEKHFNYFIV